MTAYDDVLKDLRKLRRLRAHRPIDFKDTPHLVWHTGRGNIDVTARFFVFLKNVDDVQVSAALASLGFESYSSNIEERMNQFASAHDEKTTRTVRRWTEAGFKKIANLIVEWSEEEGNDRPLVEILLHQIEPTQLRAVLVGSGTDAVMFEPIVVANGERVDVDPIPHEQRVADPYTYFKSTVAIELLSDTPAARLEIDWPGNAEARYLVQVHPTLRGHVTTSLVTKKGCEIRLVATKDFPLPERQ